MLAAQIGQGSSEEEKEESHTKNGEQQFHFTVICGGRLIRDREIKKPERSRQA